MISIHAPLRERRRRKIFMHKAELFQSTLPCGSDSSLQSLTSLKPYFNPRSLAGATMSEFFTPTGFCISIHAPLRERPRQSLYLCFTSQFQSTLPCGSDLLRPLYFVCDIQRFQSTLPCGSDLYLDTFFFFVPISIHAPLRERLRMTLALLLGLIFQSTLPCGSDLDIYAK